jgi:hypothetical protein
MTSILKGWNSIFYKIEFSHKDSKAQRKMRSIFLLRAFAPSWLTFFRSEAEKKNLLSFAKSLKYFYPQDAVHECLNLIFF